MSRESPDQLLSAEQFIRALFPDASGHLILWTRSDKRTRPFNLPERLEDAAAEARRLATSDDVYFGVGLQAKEPPVGSRGDAAGASTLPGVWLDVDVAGDAHKAKNLPPDPKSAAILLEGFPRPSVVVMTGGGAHLYWLTPTPCVGGERDRAAALCERFQRAIQGKAKALGWKVDSTFDPARVLRLPGTYNRKFAEPVEVQAKDNGHRYSLDEIEAAIRAIEPEDAINWPSAETAATVDGDGEDRPRTAERPEFAADEVLAGHDDFVMDGRSFALGERVRRYRAMLMSGRFAQSISGRNGHDQMFHAACLRFGFALSAVQARPALDEYNAAKCQPPWAAKEIDHKLKDARCWPDRSVGWLLVEEPRKVVESPAPDKAPQFPLMALPPWARRVCLSIAASAQVSPDAVAVIMLAAVSGLLARRGWGFEWKKGKSEPPNLYALVSMRPSEHKTTFVDYLSRAIWDAEKGLQESHAVETRAIKEDLARKESELAAAKRGRTPDHGRIARLTMEMEDAQVPAEPNLLAEDATPEALEEMLAGNPCVMFLSAEAQITDNMLARYSNEQSIKVYLKGWSGESYKINRKGKQKIVLDRPLLAVGVACQPDALRMMAQKIEGARGLGLLSRFLVCVPESMVGERSIDASIMDEGALADWERCVRLALGLPPRNLIQGAGSYEELRRWYGWVERGLRRELKAIEDWAGKAQAGQVARIATVLHFLWGVQSDEMPAPVMRRAVAVMGYFTQHAFRALGQYEPDGTEELASQVAEWAQRQKKPWQPRTLRANLRSARKAEEETVKDALEMLVEKGCLREEPPGTYQSTGEPNGKDGLLSVVGSLLSVPHEMEDDDMNGVNNNIEIMLSLLSGLALSTQDSPSIPPNDSIRSRMPGADNMTTTVSESGATDCQAMDCREDGADNKVTTGCQQPMEAPAKVIIDCGQDDF